MNRISVVPEPLPWPPDLANPYDLAIVALGYEERARHIAEVFEIAALSRVAVSFPSNHVLSYQRNRRVLTELGYAILTPDTARFRQELAKLLTRSTSQPEVRVLLDVSSLTRSRIAMILGELAMLASRRTVVVDLAYSPAVFNPPPAEAGAIESLGPVTPEFAGWAPEVDRAVMAIVGLGYEQDRAVGAIEFIEPGEVWVFIPQGEDPDHDPYMEALERANQLLLREVARERRVPYHVDRPLELLARLDSLVLGALRQFRPVCVPLGPKIFAVAALLVSLRYRQVGVWRISGGSAEAPLERRPTGLVVGLRAVLTAGAEAPLTGGSLESGANSST